MNANGTTTATNGASFGRRRLDLDSPPDFAFSFVAIALAVATLAVVACSPSGTKDENAQAQGQRREIQIDPALARSVHRAVQPCIRAHRALKAALYLAQLRLERAPSGKATATFRGERTPGHEAFEACAIKAIGDAAIPLAQTTTLPAAFDLGPERSD
jgi:hypothetical protein